MLRNRLRHNDDPSSYIDAQAGFTSSRRVTEQLTGQTMPDQRSPSAQRRHNQTTSESPSASNNHTASARSLARPTLQSLEKALRAHQRSLEQQNADLARVAERAQQELLTPPVLSHGQDSPEEWILDTHLEQSFRHFAKWWSPTLSRYETSSQISLRSRVYNHMLPPLSPF